MKASKRPKKKRISPPAALGFIAALGLFVMGAAHPAYAQDAALLTVKDTREFSSRDRLIDSAMAEDQAAVDDMNATLEVATADAIEALDRAGHKLNRTKRAVADTLREFANARTTVTRLQTTLDRVTQELLGAQETLVTLQTLSSSPKNTEATTDLETELNAEIAALQTTVEAARTRLHKARFTSWSTKNAAANLKTTIDKHQTAVAAAHGRLHSIRAKIDPMQLAFDEERAKVTALVGNLSREQVLSLNRSLSTAVASGALLNLDAQHLQSVLDGHYDKRQISALTRSLVSEATYLQLATRPEIGGRSTQ